MHLLVANVGKNVVPLALRSKMAQEIASGMSYLHTFSRSPIIHGDLKLLNVLIGGDFNAKVCLMIIMGWTRTLYILQ